jgi:mannose-6-phosphate isomerase
MPLEPPIEPAWLTRTPLLLASNRVYRTYTGGALLDKMQGAARPMDTHFPEEWVGSTTVTRLPGRPPEEGLSRVIVGEQTVRLTHLIETYPEAMLGAQHVRQYGRNLAVLCKLLDSAMRLSLQTHPDRGFARRHLGANFGKTESWIILETRPIAGEAPYLLFGFKDGVTEAEFRRLTKQQDTAGQIAALNRLAVQPGEVYLVPAGVPHAIGPGVCMVEVQEPTDFTVNVEYSFGGVPRTEEQCFLGLGFELGMQCFDFRATGLSCVEENRLSPRVLSETPDSRAELLVGPEHTRCFGALRLTIEGTAKTPTGECLIGIVIRGSGQIGSSQAPPLSLKPGTSFFLPAAAEAEMQADPAGPLVIIACFPPGWTPAGRAQGRKEA